MHFREPYILRRDYQSRGFNFLQVIQVTISS
ncbi:hypothetical protein F383_15619 [Gossypium arboreum]|uniref:Uncharacterized protein n=1 Tax=Gossypium arboreum TaxID=29729 RepID=A0A0B0PUM8_GOSAR|nr:hypothetical protein F383_15619 [Gossypium arboreum]